MPAAEKNPRGGDSIAAHQLRKKLRAATGRAGKRVGTGSGCFKTQKERQAAMRRVRDLERELKGLEAQEKTQK